MTPELKHLEAAGVKEPAKWLDAIVATCQEFGIDTDKRIAAFLAQTAHESAGYTALQENLNYRAAVLATCWPKRFAQLEAGVPVAKAKPLKDAKGKNIPTKFAEALEKHPEQIANVVYSARMGNGPIESGDGWKFRGRGLKQLTGRDNYTRCGKALGLDLAEQPDLLLDPGPAARSAGWFWQSNKCSDFMDRDDFKGLTIRINGGTIGLADRTQRYERVLASMAS
jgi:putative chitinase